MPIKPIRDIFKKVHIKTWSIISLALVLFVVGLYLAPKSADTNTPNTNENTDSQQIIDKNPNTDETPNTNNPHIDSTFNDSESDFETDNSAESTIPPVVDSTPVIDNENDEKESSSTPKTTYILNTDSKKFHYSSCSSAKQIKNSNKSEFSGSREDLIKNGYDPCGRCDP